ncbi:TlpA family protein disulfide reductase [Pedobacter hiemivivus]|uniref:TlpA family protein disulfide reductase n=1 Tax=Pedobacter hiemivivus TaxID=2530454 RepID=A0A4R0NI37_9SPHI|nr:TlpA disulfide reductase family protein [Pedobacter hiemivivus]TCC98464.1 TlpA family protein disulfide reductase [Pedobacter hiemivivus]
MRKIFFIFFYSLLGTMAVAQKKSILTVNVEGYKGDSLLLIANIGEGYPEKNLSIQKEIQRSGKVIHEFDLKKPLKVEIWVSRPALQVFIQPGDSLVVNCKMNGPALISSFSGNGAQNNEVFKKNQDIRIKSETNIDYTKITPDSLKSFYDKVYREQSRILIDKKDFVTPVFFSYEQTELKYGYLANLFRLPQRLATLSRKPIASCIPSSFSLFGNEMEKNEKLLFSSQYRSAIYNFIGYSLLKNDIRDSKNDRSNFKQNYLFSVNNYTGLIRSTVLPTLFLSFFHYAEDVSVMKPELEDYFSKYCHSNEAKAALLNEYSAYFKTAIGQVPPSFELTSITGEKVTLKEFKGKVIYLDFWASWCGPCRLEMKYAPQLHEKLKDNNVVFLFVSIDDDEAKWKKAIAEDKIEGIHLLSKGGFKSTVCQLFNFSGVPRYMIIGKDGKLLDNNAPRPSNPVTLERLKSAL